MEVGEKFRHFVAKKIIVGFFTIACVEYPVGTL